MQAMYVIWRLNTPPTTDGNDMEVTPDPEPSEATEPVTALQHLSHSHLKRMAVNNINQIYPIQITIIKRKVYKSLINPKHQQERSRLFLMNNEGNEKVDISSNQTVATGYISSVKNALKYESLLTKDWSKFILVGNPFAMPQCTYYAWSRFYQVYGFSSGAFGNGKDNAREIVAVHGDKFSLSSTHSGGAVFWSRRTLYIRSMVM